MSDKPVRLTLTIGADGRVAAETHDALGQDCLPYVQALEDLLEATTEDSAYTADWWRTETVRTEPSVVEPQREQLDGRW
ncbi:DUF2997 domain-containing protein [Nocardia lasii]|uniref:DUF2997 domain-containing protein n=1 Tax=Nocardia lasii TaxID=1616107 RepID=A0ABW1JLJ4_9NOCA